MKLRSTKQPEEKVEPNLTKGLDLSALLSALQAVNSAMDLEQALRHVLASAKNLCEAHEGSVMLIDDEGFLRIVVSEGIPFDVAQNVRIAPGEGVSGRVAQTGQPVLLSGKADGSTFDSFVEKARVLISAISVPLIAAERLVGVLNLNLTAGERTFEEADLRTAQVFAEQAAMAIYKARLLEQSERRGNDLASLLENSRQLIGVMKLEPVVLQVLDSCLELTSSRGGFALIFEEETSRVTLGVYRGFSSTELRDLLANPNFLSSFHNDRMGVARVGDSPIFQSIAPATELAITTATSTGNQTRALFAMFTSTYDAEKMKLCETYLAQASLAIRNAKLYEAVATKEMELASIVYSMDNPVMVADGSGSLIVANPPAEQLFGFSTEYAKGQPVASVLTNEVLLDALITGKEQTIEVAVGQPELRTWKAKTSKIRNEARGLSGHILVMDDVTKEREMQKLKADFVAVIGHELRTPLTLIKGFTRTLLRRGDQLKPSEAAEALRTVESQTSRLERLIEDLLYVSHIETARPPLHVESVDLVELVTGLMQEFQAKQPEREYHLLAPASLMVMFDKTKIEQVMFHLLDNASKYSEDNEPVAVEIVDGATEVTVKVVDKGTGILSGDIPNLFQLFHQIDATSTREAGGTGVGLYICKSMVTAHGGHISIDSTWGKGSTFTFTIPKGLAPKARRVSALSSREPVSPQ